MFYEEKHAIIDKVKPITTKSANRKYSDVFICLFVYLSIMDGKTLRVKTGVEGLDRLLGGGLEEKNVYLVAGESGTGRTVLCLQFLYAGLKRGESAIYVAVHKTPRDIIGDARSFDWDLEQYIKNKNLIILDMSPYISKINEGETLSVRQMMAELTKSVHTNNAKLIIVDSMEFIASHVTNSERDIREYVREIILAIGHNLECTAMITSRIIHGEKKLSQSGMEEDMVSGIILLDTDKDGMHRTMQIKKMRQTNVDLSHYSFYIDPKKGIVITGKLDGGIV